MVSFLNRIVERFKSQSALGARIGDCVQNTAWLFKQTILELAPDARPPASFSGMADVTWRTATLQDLQAMARSADYLIGECDLSYYHALISDGNLMMLAERNSEILAYSCIAFGKKVFSQRYFKLSPDEGFVLACFTKPGFRGKGLGVEALWALKRVAEQSRGALRLFAHVDTWNQSSLRMLRKAGFISAETQMYRIRLLRWDLVHQAGKYADRFISEKEIRQPAREAIAHHQPKNSAQ
jgi:RimJ/RimL family protein N-acetyltransferase